MSKLTSRTTIYLDPAVKAPAQHACLDHATSLSKLVNNLLAEWVGDVEALRKAIREKGEVAKKEGVDL